MAADGFIRSLISVVLTKPGRRSEVCDEQQFGESRACTALERRRELVQAGAFGGGISGNVGALRKVPDANAVTLASSSAMRRSIKSRSSIVRLSAAMYDSG